MYWRGAFPGISLETHPQLGGDVKFPAGIRQTMSNYMDGLQRYLALTGVSAKTLAPQVVDPTPQIEVQIQAICIKMGIPKRIFEGSERGELASSQDSSAWNGRIRARQDNYLTPRLIVPFIDRLIAVGVLPEPKADTTKASKDELLDEEGNPVDEQDNPLDEDQIGTGDELPKADFTPGVTVNGTEPVSPVSPGPFPNKPMSVKFKGEEGFANPAGQDQQDKGEPNGKAPTERKPPKGYSVKWPDLVSLMPGDEAIVAVAQTTALANYVKGAVEDLMTPRDYLIRILKFSDEEADSILDAAADAADQQLTIEPPPPLGTLPTAFGGPPGTELQPGKPPGPGQPLAFGKAPPPQPGVTPPALAPFAKAVQSKAVAKPNPFGGKGA
jgi:hypothetical protein